ncbi:MAG: outer membrane lipoprotein carrier protein LolA [Alphaproteobacteria bacterium]
MIRYLAVVLAALVLPAAAGPTATVEPAVLSPDDRADIGRIEAYLNDVTTFESRFLQIGETGMAQGQMYLSRPGKMRVEYDPPVPVLMVASAPWVMYHDSKLKQTSFIPISRTPAAFLLRETIDLDEGLVITGFERGYSALRLTVVTTANPDAGSLTLVMEDRPLRLVKWTVMDAQGKRIEVALLDPRFGVELNDEMFSIVDPNLREGRN